MHNIDPCAASRGQPPRLRGPGQAGVVHDHVRLQLRAQRLPRPAAGEELYEHGTSLDWAHPDHPGRVGVPNHATSIQLPDLHQGLDTRTAVIRVTRLNLRKIALNTAQPITAVIFEKLP
jgi:hypothetical protein